MSDKLSSSSDAMPKERSQDLELEKLRLEQARYRTDILKWIVLAVGAVISFAVIDYGKLQLDRFRAAAENQRELLNSYLKATESPEPDVWKRKLHLLVNFSDDQRMKVWAESELKYIENFAALDALYRETLKIASQLVEPSRMANPERVQARARFNQLYWGDLPYAGESQQVIEAMIAFREQLIIAEKAGTEPEQKTEWEKLDTRLIELSKALRESTPSNQPQPPGPASRS